MKYNYYYNNVPGMGLCRNNLIYTSLISQDKKVFCKWYYNDTEYHQGQNQVVDPSLMNQKWQREVKYLSLMNNKHSELIPKILDIDYISKKIYLEIDGVDFWQLSLDKSADYNKVLPDWQDQMLFIFKTYKHLKIWKYSLHPSSYFIVDGRLKSINYFFTYDDNEGPITVKDHLSHISLERQASLKEISNKIGLSWETPQTLLTMQILAFESFKNNYPLDFIEKGKNVFL